MRLGDYVRTPFGKGQVVGVQGGTNRPTLVTVRIPTDEGMEVVILPPQEIDDSPIVEWM